MTVDQDSMIRIEEFATITGIDEAKIVEMIRGGFIRGHQVDGNWFVERDNLDSHTSSADHPARDHIRAHNSYTVFTRKQLAWMGVFMGSLILWLLNTEWDYSVPMEELTGELFSWRNRRQGYWLLNAGLASVIWFGRVHLGYIFAFLLGAAFNLIAFIGKKI